MTMNCRITLTGIWNTRMRNKVKSNTTNIITVLINLLFCKEERIIDGTIFFDTCSMTVRFFGTLKGEKQKENEIRK